MPAIIPSLTVKNMLNTHWDTGNVAKPVLVDLNDGAAGSQISWDLRNADIALIAADAPAEEEQPIGTWIYANRITKVMIELHTKVSRQRIYDLKDEIRRIFHARMHLESNYQRIQYVNFFEMIPENVNVWSGRILVELVNSAVLMEV